MQVLNKTGTIKRFIPVRNPGWRNYPLEHSLASRGIKTANNNEPLHVELYMEPENMSHSDIDRLYEYREPEDIINDWNKLHDDYRRGFITQEEYEREKFVLSQQFGNFQDR